MFAGYPVLISPESGELVVNALQKLVAAVREVAPATEQRILIIR
jgi:hypothetical protein